MLYQLQRNEIMLFLHFILVSCLLVGIPLSHAAVVDTSENGMDEASTHKDTQLEEVQGKLKTMEETQILLVKKLELLLNMERKHYSVSEMRVRGEEGEQPQTDVTATPESDTSPVNCPNCLESSCMPCPAGPRGYPGPPGPPGRDGRDGRDSVAVSVTGSENSECTPSSQVPTNTSGGSVYVRWGHSECPSHSILIYTGSAAGANYGASGNGANQLCLPDEPDYHNSVAGVGASRASLYSIEYQINNFPTLESRNWLDVSCAVCSAPSRFGQLMTPGKLTCPSAEWTLEYSGYLMAENNHVNHMRSMYICVDREMQSLERTHGANSARGLLDLVESRCSSSGGGLPCGPYIDGYEVTCAVCTQ